MPVHKPTISHQLKTVKSQKPKPTNVIHAISNVVAISPHNRSHLISTHSQPKSTYSKTNGNLINASNLSNSDLKHCTKLLRNVLSSEENKSTSTTDDYHCSKLTSIRSVAFKSPDQSITADQLNNPIEQRKLFIEESDDRTDAESLTSNPDQKSDIYNNNNSFNPKFIISQSTNSQPTYCICQPSITHTMHDSRPLHNSGDSQRINDKISVCTRCHNIIPPLTNTPQDKEIADGFFNKGANEDYYPAKLSDMYHHNPHPPVGHNDFKSPHQHSDLAGDKMDNFMTHLHMKINELQSIARVTRDADLGRIICEIEQTFQKMIRENSLLSNHLKTIAKTLKWENSALKQKIKNQSESNRDMKSELKLIRQEQKQKIEELKLEVQLKNEEIRQMADRDKSSLSQLKDKYSSLEKEHEKLRSDFQGQILNACHKDTDIIQLKHSCSQVESKLKDEIHSLTLANQNIKQELQISQSQCTKYEQELSHNQMIIKAAREQVVNLLDRHKQNRVETNSCSYRFDQVCDTSASGEWINQATNLQQVLSMATDNRDKQLLQQKDKYNNLIPAINWGSNYYSPNQQPSDQSNLTNGSMNNFAASNFNNNYVSSSSYNPILSDSTNPLSNYETIPFKQQQQPNFLNACERSQSPSNMSSTMSDNSLNMSVTANVDRSNVLEKSQQQQIKSRRSSGSSDSDIHGNLWSLPQPTYKISSASSMMSTVSSLRSSDDREFRKGLKRLDSQISRLQNTLQSNLQCK